MRRTKCYLEFATTLYSLLHVQPRRFLPTTGIDTFTYCYFLFNFIPYYFLQIFRIPHLHPCLHLVCLLTLSSLRISFPISWTQRNIWTPVSKYLPFLLVWLKMLTWKVFIGSRNSFSISSIYLRVNNISNFPPSN